MQTFNNYFMFIYNINYELSIYLLNLYNFLLSYIFKFVKDLFLLKAALFIYFTASTT